MTASGAAHRRRSSAAMAPRRAITAASGSGISMMALCWAPPAPLPTKNRARRRGWKQQHQRLSALSGLVSRIGLVDHVDAALAAHDAAILVARLERFEGILDFHDGRDREPLWKAAKIGKKGGRVNRASGEACDSRRIDRELLARRRRQDLLAPRPSARHVPAREE